MLQARSNGSAETASAPPVSPLSESALRHTIRSNFAGVKGNPQGQKIIFLHITPAVARAMQRDLMFTRQRGLREPNLKRLMTGIEAGEFLNNNVIWVCVKKDTDEMVVINGQHTLEAIVQSNTDWFLPCVLDPVPDEAAVELRYSLFDMGASRSTADILRMMSITLDLRGEEEAEPIYATQRQIRKSSDAVTWLSTGLASNNSSWGKFERGNAVREEWRPEIVKFWQLLGDKVDPELPAGAAATWEKFWDQVSGGTYMAPLLASLRAFPEETERLISDLIALARAGGKLDADESADAAWQAVSNFFELIMADSRSFTGSRRSLLEWRLCLYLAHARDGSPDARKDERSKSRAKGYAHSQQNWKLATGDRIEKPSMRFVEVDMGAARERRAERAAA